MNDEDEDLRASGSHFVALVLLTMAGISLVMCGPPAHAQRREDAALTIARLVCHESGFDHPADAAAIVAVLRNAGAREHMEPVAFARVYAPRYAHHTIERQWVYGLDAEGSDPHAGIRWTLYRDRWLAILAATRAALAAPDVVCDATVWGSRGDFARRRARGVRERMVDCGDTANLFATGAR